jgi:hypothetical protein
VDVPVRVGAGRPNHTRRRRRRRAALAFAAALVAGTLGARTLARARSAAGVPAAAAVAPTPRGETALDDCAACHAEIAAEWARSAHARSWTDPIFQAEYRLNPDAFCRGCHAPRLHEAELDAASANAAAAPDDAARADRAAARGIDCTVCHVRDGRVLGVHGHGGEHAALREARLATSAFCGDCHQFDFPAPAPAERARYLPGRPLQDTLAEWARSNFADRPCQDCHMPPAGEGSARHRSHAFRVLDDPALLARAVRVIAAAHREGRAILVTIELAPGEIGHAFPTGDMFRQAVLTVCAGASQRREILRRYFAQTITPDGRGHLLGQVDDTRVPPPGAGEAPRLKFRLDDPDASEVSWSLELFRLDPDDARGRGLAEAARGVPVVAGRVPIGPAARR